jgi:signal transduction histidine kinase
VAEHIGGCDQTDAGQRCDAPTTPGLYIRVSVIDHGVGMSAEVLAHAGEQFFTTKPSGQGTGLGLAGARKFAERLGGKLSIQSKVGQGTTVSLWLPVVSPGLPLARTMAESVGTRY